MDHFELVSEYQPTGDQPQAIEQLVQGRQSMPDFTRGYGFRKNFYDGKRYRAASETDTCNRSQ